MSSFLCFICHSTVNSDTNEETRDKYRDVVGMNLCPDSHLCYICVHVMKKLWLFKSICLKRSLEYPVLFSEKGTINLQRSDPEMQILCEENCDHFHNRNINTKTYHFIYNYHNIHKDTNYNVKYVDIEEKDFNYHRNEENGFEIDDHSDFIDNVSPHDDFKRNDFDNDDVNDTCNNFNDDNDLITQNDTIKDFDKIENSMDAQIEEIPDLSNTNDKYDEDFDSYAQNSVGTNEMESEQDIKKTKRKGKKKKEEELVDGLFTKYFLTEEEQRAELEAARKGKKYIEAEFKCYNCGIGFQFKDTYQAHMVRHEESNGEYRCPICTLRFASVRVFRAHLATHSARLHCSACGARLPARARGPHRARCRGEGVACAMCGGSFVDKTGLQQHMRRYHRDKQSNRTYSCNVCGKICNTKAAVRSHMIVHATRRIRRQTARAPVALSCCGRDYTSRKSLLAHCRNSKTHQTAPCICPICGRGLANKLSLQRHVARHTAPSAPRPRRERPSLCHYCAKPFKSTSNLKRHLKEVCEKNKLEEELAALYNES